MNEDTEKDAEIKSRIDNVTEAIAAVRKDLLAKLPKMERAGRTITKGLQISVSSLSAAEAAA
jgi:hypothetical protein